MTCSMQIATLAFPALILAMLPNQAAGQSTRTPKPVAKCLPPGATKPVACATSRAGEVIRLQVATTRLPRRPISLLFTEEAAPGKAPRSATVTIAPVISRDGGYNVTVPRQLCAAGSDRLGNFEIQRLMSTYNQAETIRDSLGMLTVAC